MYSIVLLWLHWSTDNRCLGRSLQVNFQKGITTSFLVLGRLFCFLCYQRRNATSGLLRLIWFCVLMTMSWLLVQVEGKCLSMQYVDTISNIVISTGYMDCGWILISTMELVACVQHSRTLHYVRHQINSLAHLLKFIVVHETIHYCSITKISKIQKIT